MRSSQQRFCQKVIDSPNKKPCHSSPPGGHPFDLIRSSSQRMNTSSGKEGNINFELSRSSCKLIFYKLLDLIQHSEIVKFLRKGKFIMKMSLQENKHIQQVYVLSYWSSRSLRPRVKSTSRFCPDKELAPIVFLLFPDVKKAFDDLVSHFNEKREFGALPVG